MPDGTNQTDLTQLLVDWSQGRPEALDALLPRVHSELQKLAGAYLRRERPDHTLESGALVNEAYLRLIQQDRVQWKNSHAFLRCGGPVDAPHPGGPCPQSRCSQAGSWRDDALRQPFGRRVRTTSS